MSMELEAALRGVAAEAERQPVVAMALCVGILAFTLLLHALLATRRRLNELLRHQQVKARCASNAYSSICGAVWRTWCVLWPRVVPAKWRC